jgi:hypothetical protein
MPQQTIKNEKQERANLKTSVLTYRFGSSRINFTLLECSYDVGYGLTVAISIDGWLCPDGEALLESDVRVVEPIEPRIGLGT